MKQQSEYLFNLSRLYLRWLFMLLLLAVVVVFGLQSINIEAWVIVQVLIYALMSGLLIYAPLNLYFGAWCYFSPFELGRSLISFLIAGTGISMLFQQPMPPLPSVFGGCALTVVTIFLMHRYCIWLLKKEENIATTGGFSQSELNAKEQPSAEVDNRPSDDASIRGKAAIFQYGNNKYVLSNRQNTGKNTAAERFERKLIRFLEHAFEVPILAYQGTGTHYWVFKPTGFPGPIEFIVIGHEFNTACRLKEEQRWILRVREPKPGWFANWLSQLFPAGVALERNLGAYLQTQFPSLDVDDKSLFSQPLSAPVPVHQLTEQQARDLIMNLERALSNSVENEMATDNDTKNIGFDKSLHKLH